MNKFFVCLLFIFFSYCKLYPQAVSYKKTVALADSLYMQYDSPGAIAIIKGALKKPLLSINQKANLYFRLGNLYLDCQLYDSADIFFETAKSFLKKEDDIALRTNIILKKTLLPKYSINVDDNLKAIYGIMREPAFEKINAGTKSRALWYWLSISWLLNNEDENEINYKNLISLINKTDINSLPDLLDRQALFESSCSAISFLIVNNKDTIKANKYLLLAQKNTDTLYKRNKVILNNTLGLLYFYRNELEQSKLAYKSCLAFTPINTYDFSSVNFMIGKILHQQDSIDLSIKYLKLAEASIKKIYEPYHYNNQLLKWLANAYISKDSSSTAVYYLVKYIEMSRIINDGRNLSSLKAYKFIKEIEQLSQQRFQDEQKHKGEKKTFIIIIIASSIVLIALLILLYIYRNFNSRLRHQKKQLELALKKNKTLVKEMHHRVKNNLQTISGLLNLQSKKLNNKDAIKAMTDAQNRIQSVSIIHQSLYQNASDSESIINIREYCYNLTKHIEHIYKNESVSVAIDVPVNIHFSLDTAIPLGLILNEFITNSFKHAFNAIEDGKIFISLEYIPDKNQFLLKYRDNGAGVSQQKDSGSFGLSLINMLTLQLGATIIFPTENNNEFLLFFNATNIIFAS